MNESTFRKAARELTEIAAMELNAGDLLLEDMIRALEANGVKNDLEKAIYADACHMLNTDR